jgi:hypothetical protein
MDAQKMDVPEMDVPASCNFLYSFRARACGTPTPGLSPATAQESASWPSGKAWTERQHHQADGDGKCGGLSAPGASAKAAPSRVRTLPGAAADAGRQSPLPLGRW